MKIMKQASSVMVRAMLIVALVFGLAPLVQAQSPVAKGKPVATKTKSPASAKPSGGPQEGIKVHGHWTIEVRNPDGSLASHTEFENALAPQGQSVLALLLGRSYVMGPWQIGLGDGTGAGPCQGPTNVGLQSTECVIAEPGVISFSGQAEPWQFINLTRTISSNNQGLELSGTATAALAFIVSWVTTSQTVCPDPNRSPNDCALAPFQILGAAPLNLQFTAHRLQNPVSVVAGQIVQVKVVLSFS